MSYYIKFFVWSLITITNFGFFNSKKMRDKIVNIVLDVVFFNDLMGLAIVIDISFKEGSA